MRALLAIVLLSIFLSYCVQATTAGSLKKGDEKLSYAERLPQEYDTRMRHADVYLFKSTIVSNIANHWGLLFLFRDKYITIEGIRQGRKLQSKYTVTNGISVHFEIYKLTQRVMTQNHDTLEKAFGWLFGSIYTQRRRQLGDFPNGVTVSPAQLRDIAANNPFDNVEYKLQVRDCQTWAIASTTALAKYKNY